MFQPFILTVGCFRFLTQRHFWWVHVLLCGYVLVWLASMRTHVQEDLACRGKLLGQQMKYSRTKGERKWSSEDTELTITKWNKSLAKKAWPWLKQFSLLILLSKLPYPYRVQRSKSVITKYTLKNTHGTRKILESEWTFRLVSAAVVAGNQIKLSAYSSWTPGSRHVCFSVPTWSLVALGSSERR